MANTVSFTEEDLEYLRSISIYVATPCYGEMCSAYFARSLAMLFSIASGYEIPVSYSLIGNESLITRARNEMTGGFLDSEATHLMFIDADISFDPMDVFKLALHKRDLIAAAYPTKGLNYKNAIGKATEQEVKHGLINYVINFSEEEIKQVDDEGKLKVTLHGGLLPVTDAGTGFMLISRDVFVKMIEEYKDDIMYVSDSSTVDSNGDIARSKETRYAFFDTSFELKSNRYLSEDYTFCRRWQHIGGQVFVDPNIVLNHHGSYTYRGYPLLDK